MKTKTIFLSLILLSAVFGSCTNDENRDIEKNIQITIYGETGYAKTLLSDVWTDPLLFTENNDNQKQMLLDIITEGLDFDYEKGYEYRFKAKKVWMHDPPQDVSSVKYIFMELLSKKKVTTENSEENIQLVVAPKTVKFMPRYSKLYNDENIPKLYDALLVKQNNTDNRMLLTEIDGFNFENGYEYLLEVKKITNVDPYSVKYILVEILSKKENNK